MPLFSVVIPVYNAEKFLKRCLDSFTAQTFQYWTAVCVDDGSTDSSPSILDEFAASDNRFIVIHKANGGVSEARNEGLKKAVGRYISFIDSDDFIHPQTFEICAKIISDTSPDLIAYTYNRGYRTSTLIRNFLGIGSLATPRYRQYDIDSIEYVVTDDIYRYATEYSRPELPANERKWAVKHCQPWRCMYKREVVEQLRFIPGIIYEDFPWWGEVLINARKAAILNLPLYFYYANPKSYILSSDQSFRIESLRKAIEASEKIYEERASDYQKACWRANFIKPFKEKLSKKEGS